MKKQAKDIRAQIALAQEAAGWRQAVQQQAGRTVLAVPKSAFALQQSRQFPAVVYSAVGYAMGRYTYMPDVVSGFLRRHQRWFSPAWMARIEALIRQHLDDPSQNEPQPEVWRPLAEDLARWQAQPDRKEPTMKQYKPLQPVSEMERISREELAARLDEILARVEQENIGFVITDGGKPDLVLCPYAWFDPALLDDLGCVVNSAIRDAIRTGGEDGAAVRQFVRNHLLDLDGKTLHVAAGDLQQMFLPASMSEVEKREWNELLAQIETRLQALKEGQSP